MPLLACGINHKSTPLSLREKVSFDPDRSSEILRQLTQQKSLNEVVLLSTCNRTEIYAVSTDMDPLLSFLDQALGSSEVKSFYHSKDADMVKHVMRVASGLDSMILGEPQILGQMKKAYQLACQAGTVGSQFKHLFPAVFAASKRIRSQTTFSSNPFSIAYAISQLAHYVFQNVSHCRVLLIGAGEIIESIGIHIHREKVAQIIIANRTRARAENLASVINAKVISISDIQNQLSQADIIVSATSSALPLLGKGLVERAVRERKHRPLLLIDLAVPRDIEPEVADLEDAYLYNLDDLKILIEQNSRHLEAQINQAESMVLTFVDQYLGRLRMMKASDTISRFRRHAEDVRDRELGKALDHLNRTQDPARSLAYLAHRLTSKIIHPPTLKLRQAAYEERLDVLLSAKDLFDL